MRTLLKNECDEMLAQSEVIEQDGHGVKVARLSDGNFLKTFWYRRLVSSRRIYPEWLRFTLHAGALRRRGIPTVTVLETLRIPHLKRTGVIYVPLAGCTLRQVYAAGEFDPELAGRLGRFLAELHRKGVCFHSLHLGNILLRPEGDFGLIDISDMKIFPWPLSVGTRLRNFHHLLRYDEDSGILTQAGIDGFFQAYLNEYPSEKMRRRLTL